MDIDLLSKMISELIVDHDRVGLPGVGTFYTEVVPSTFSDRGYTINPPYRRLSFLPNAVENDLLVNFYSDVNGTPADMAREYIVQFLRELAEALKEHKTITLPGLGRLRATKENNFFFVADEDLDIYPEAFGLAPVSLKNIPGLDDDKVDIRFEFKPPVRKAAEPEPAYAASVEPAEPEITVEPAEPAVAVEPTESAALSASAATAAVAEPAKVASPAETVAPIVPAGPAASAERTETAEPAESAELIEPAEPAVAAAPEASVQEPNAAVPETSGPSAPVAEPVSGAGTSAAAETTAMQEPASESAEGAEVSSGVDATAEPAEPGALANCAEETRVVEEDDGQTEKKLPSAERIPAPAAEEDDGRTVKKFRWWIPLLVLSALAAIFLAVFLILAHVAPDFIDSILYTPEELRIINY